jgi:hypothetical protein
MPMATETLPTEQTERMEPMGKRTMQQGIGEDGEQVVHMLRALVGSELESACRSVSIECTNSSSLSEIPSLWSYRPSPVSSCHYRLYSPLFTTVLVL